MEEMDRRIGVDTSYDQAHRTARILPGIAALQRQLRVEQELRTAAISSPEAASAASAAPTVAED